MTDDRVARICVSSFPFFGSRSLRKLKNGFASWSDVWTANYEGLVRAGLNDNATTRFLDWRRDFDVLAFVRKTEEQNIKILFPEDLGYPSAFRTSSDPPEILFVRGELADAPAISIVGTRKITNYGQRCAETMVPDLVRAGFVIVSGLALGVDGAVHRATLDAGGKTVAILGTGVDDAAIYPREHFQLAQQIIANGGAVISEFPPGADSRKEHFPIRNRLIASLSLATLVIEATTDSGSLITAKLALEENREVLAVPGPIWSEQSTGTNQLLKLGAKVCTAASDVLDAIQLDRPDLVAETRATLPVDPSEQIILELLTEPRHIDEIGRAAELDPAQVSAQLVVLELKGLVKSVGGQMWIRQKSK